VFCQKIFAGYNSKRNNLPYFVGLATNITRTSEAAYFKLTQEVNCDTKTQLWHKKSITAQAVSNILQSKLIETL